MRPSWWRFDYIPPELGLTREERTEIKRVARAYAQDRRRSWNWFTSQQAWILFISLAVLCVLSGMTFAPGIWVVPIWAGGMLGIWLYDLRWIDRRATLEALRDFGIVVCAHCGYIIRGDKFHDPICPECGKIIVTRSAQ